MCLQNASTRYLVRTPCSARCWPSPVPPQGRFSSFLLHFSLRSFFAQGCRYIKLILLTECLQMAHWLRPGGICLQISIAEVVRSISLRCTLLELSPVPVLLSRASTTRVSTRGLSIPWYKPRIIYAMQSCITLHPQLPNRLLVGLFIIGSLHKAARRQKSHPPMHFNLRVIRSYIARARKRP